MLTVEQHRWLCLISMLFSGFLILGLGRWDNLSVLLGCVAWIVDMRILTRLKDRGEI